MIERAPRNRIVDRAKACAAGQHQHVFTKECGVDVCRICKDHRGLERCYCGWARSGGDGRREIDDMEEADGCDLDPADQSWPGVSFGDDDEPQDRGPPW